MLNVITENIAAIEQKYRNTIKKHPVLCEQWTTLDACELKDLLINLRERNDMDEANGTSSFMKLVNEELAEFLLAVKLKNYKEARKELIDIIVLCLRALAKIRKERKGY